MDLGHSLHDVTVARWLLSSAAPPLFPVSYSHMLQNRALPQYLPEETLCTHTATIAAVHPIVSLTHPAHGVQSETSTYPLTAEHAVCLLSHQGVGQQVL